MATDFGFLPVKDGKFYFISYNTEDSARVAQIVRYMHERGVPFWYDYGLEYGKEWETQIASHIAECEAVLMFVTNGLFFKEKSFVRKEYDEAMIYGKRIIPVFLDYIDASSLPKYSVGFYVDLDRLHNVSYENGCSVQEIAKRTILALESKADIKPGETKWPEPTFSSGWSIKSTLVAIICAIVVIVAGVGVCGAMDKDNSEPPKKPVSVSTTTTTTTKKTTTTTTTTTKKTTTTTTTTAKKWYANSSALKSVASNARKYASSRGMINYYDASPEDKSAGVVVDGKFNAYKYSSSDEMLRVICDFISKHDNNTKRLYKIRWDANNGGGEFVRVQIIEAS